MNIISQNNGNVNITINNFSSNKKQKPSSTKRKLVDDNVKTAKRIARAKAKRAERQAEERKPQMQRWQEHKADARLVGDKMIKAGLYKRGKRIKMCGNELEFAICSDCGYVSIKRAQLCRDRLCPICNWRLAIKRYISMTQIMGLLYKRYPNYHYSLVTLTAANCKPDYIKQQISLMQQAWESMRQQRWARVDLAGWARSIEVTFNEKSGELHPHYHIIVMSERAGTDKAVIEEWLEQCRKRGLKVSPKAQNADTIISAHTKGESLVGAICETFKYMVKSTDTLKCQ